MDLKVLITVFQKMIWFSGIWATVHMQLKYQKWCWLSRNLNLNSSNSNTNISKTLSHTKINNTIFWKHVTRPFRCIYVNYFNLLGFFSWGQHKIEKMHFFFQNLKMKEHENYTDHLIFFIYIFCSTCLQHSFLNLEIHKIHFQIHYFGPFWSVK